MKIHRAIIAALIAASVLVSTVTAYADPRPDPVEVLGDGVEIATEIEMGEEPEYISFYCCGVWTTNDHREIKFNDGSVGYMYPSESRYVFVPLVGVSVERYDVGEFVGDIVRYQWSEYGQCVDGCPIPSAWGDDYTYFIFSREIDDYIRIFEYLYGVL